MLKRIFQILVFTSLALAQNTKTVGVSLNYILSAFVYPNVISSDRGLRNYSIEISNWFGFSADLRYEFIPNYQLGLGFELVNKETQDYETYRVGQQILKIPVQDNFKIYIAELNAYFIAPFSSEIWQIYFGGGVGAYKGNFKKSISNLQSRTTFAPINFGIQVLAGVQFNFRKKIGLRTEFKFRDPLVEVERKFEQNRFEYQGYSIPIDNSPFRTKINFDTLTLVLSFVLKF